MTNVLDKGFVELQTAWGGDGVIYLAAHMSRGGVKDVPEKEEVYRLLHLLMSSTPPHMSPFEFAGFTVRIKAPLFVARQLVRHRLTSWMEKSLRYCVADEEYYTPDLKRVDPKGSQAQSITALTIRSYRSHMQQAFKKYHYLVNEGWPQEVARGVLGTAVYTEWYMSANLREWMHILLLRDDPHAQWETQQYARAIGGYFEVWFPVVWRVFQEHKKRLKEE